MKPTFPRQIFITGIDTGIGKTITAAVLTEALQADYWKPIQTGTVEDCDSDTVRALWSNAKSRVHAESYRLRHPSSPHYAAALEHKTVIMDDIVLPKTDNYLVVEGAGGLMVPLNRRQLMIDLMVHLSIPVLLVAKCYLGGINHTLLSAAALHERNIPLAGLVFQGDNFLDNEEISAHFAQAPILGRIAQAETVNKLFIAQQAAKLRLSLSEYFELP